MIRKANNARLLLKRRGVHGRWLKLQDDRQVKGTMTAYLFFFVDRRASGDFAHISVQEATKRIAQEWKDLSTEEKQVSDIKYPYYLMPLLKPVSGLCGTPEAGPG